MVKVDFLELRYLGVLLVVNKVGLYFMGFIFNVLFVFFGNDCFEGLVVFFLSIFMIFSIVGLLLGEF